MSSSNGGLLKAGELAKRFGILTSTIRYYTNIGLLQSDGRSPGGYNLYDFMKAKGALDKIKHLKDKRFTLDEIKEKLFIKG
ncbi:MerR family DNA-binding transcriptional regulator [Candidatus Margulisiibacteriota bacterium]